MSGKEKKRYINFKVDTYFRETPSRRSRESCGGTFVRCIKFLAFCAVCTGSLFQALAPWMLSAIELLTELLLYFLGMPYHLALVEKPTQQLHHFTFRSSVDDILILCITRSVIISLTYAYGHSRYHYRPFLLAAYLLGGGGLVYVAIKAIFFRYASHWLVASLMMIVFGVYSVIHVLAAQRSVDWARRRVSMGLLGFSQAWDDEESWHLLRRGVLDSDGPKPTSSDGGLPEDRERDVPPEVLAEPDSLFVEVDGIRVHYKEVAPFCATEVDERLAVVCMHGFGGGTFSWRHLMEPLAMQCQCRVVAFDRPGFGLSSRPPVLRNQPNPYSLSSQAQLTLRFCKAIGLRRVVLLGHADGALLGLISAALASRGPAAFCFSQMPPSQSIDQTVGSVGGESTPRFLSRLRHHLNSTASTMMDTSFVSLDIPPCQPLMTSVPSPGSLSGSSSAKETSKSSLSLQSMAREASGGDSSPGSTQPSLAGGESGASSPLKEDLVEDNGKDTPLYDKEISTVASVGGDVPCSSASVLSSTEVVGLGLLHPNFSGHLGPALTRLLAKSKLGRSILRPLLRTEIGEVASRRSWHNPDKLTREVLELYKSPLRVQGWDHALMEITKLKKEFKPEDLALLFVDVRHLPALVVTGEHDRIVSPSRAESITHGLPSSELVVIPDCGHLSHEEAPSVLLPVLVQFCGGVQYRRLPKLTLNREVSTTPRES